MNRAPSSRLISQPSGPSLVSYTATVLAKKKGRRVFRPAALLALELHLVVRRLDRRRRRFVDRNLHVAVVLEARARRDEAAHRDVLLQAAQVIHLA